MGTNIENQTEQTPEEPREDHEGMTIVMIGEVAVWITLGEYYSRYNH